MKKLTAAQKAEMKKRFDTYDVDHNGSITIKECEKILGEYMDDTEIKAFFVTADKNKNGRISRKEFDAI